MPPFETGAERSPPARKVAGPAQDEVGFIAPPQDDPSTFFDREATRVGCWTRSEKENSARPARSTRLPLPLKYLKTLIHSTTGPTAGATRYGGSGCGNSAARPIERQLSPKALARAIVSASSLAPFYSGGFDFLYAHPF